MKLKINKKDFLNQKSFVLYLFLKKGTDLGDWFISGCCYMIGPFILVAVVLVQFVAHWLYSK